jgi:hypothetical protein
VDEDGVRLPAPAQLDRLPAPHGQGLDLVALGALEGRDQRVEQPGVLRAGRRCEHERAALRAGGAGVAAAAGECRDRDQQQDQDTVPN